jgi:hypothetical protein
MNNTKTIDYLWNFGTEQDWENELKKYYDLVKPSNMQLELELDQLNSDTIKNLTTLEFYNFLHEKYFVWKYTAAHRLATTRKYLEKYLLNT